MGLSAFARTRALRIIFDGDLMIGLTRSGAEIEDGGYARQRIRFESATEATVASVADARFGPWRESVSTVTGWVVFDGAGRELASGELAEREDGKQGEPLRGDELVLRAGKVIAGLD
jgi:hypothetical protein